VLRPCITPPRSLQGNLEMPRHSRGLKGNFLFPCQIPRAARVQSNVHESASGRQHMGGTELNIRREANQRALVEKPKRSGPFLPR